MAWFHPAWLEHQRRRWTLPDQRRFNRPPQDPTQADTARNRMDDAAIARTVSGSERLAIKLTLAGLNFELALLRRALRLKANFDPDQPRVPAGNPDGGQWTDAGGTSGSTDVSGAKRKLKDSPTGSSPDEPPKIPKEAPKTIQERNAVVKSIARWMARAVRLGHPIGLLLHIIEGIEWLVEHRPRIDANLDPPKTLEELQDAVSSRAPGYHVHHIVEQGPAAQEGYPWSMINAPENLVRIPEEKHREITAWFATKNDDFGGLSPRDYLRGKSWDERTRVGLDAMIDFKVLKR